MSSIAFLRKRDRRLDYIISGLMVPAIRLFAFDQFMPVGAGLAREHGAQDADSDSRAQSALLQEDSPGLRETQR